MKRCFISIELPEKIKKEIEKVQNNLHGFLGKKTELKNLHLTLKFLGEIEEDKIERIRKKLREINFKKINCSIDGLGFFSPKQIRIIWVHLNNCEKLQKQIDEKLSGFFECEKRFMSHVTIARVKFVKNKKKFLEELRKIEVKEKGFNIGEFYLMGSILKPEGPEYRIIEKFESR